jgi:hypothetical protein
MVSGFPFHDEWQSYSTVRTLLNGARWNQYVLNWSVVLAALRQLWETGKVSELKSPFYDVLEKPESK